MDADIRTVEALSAELPARARGIEAERQMPADLVKDLVTAGAMRMLVPRRHGGSAVDLRAALRVIEMLARGDGSTGWAVGQVTLAQLIFSCFPDEAQQAVYASGPDTLGAGAVAPKGRATDRRDHWQVSGQWPFVTGCRFAEWVYLTCVVVDGHRVRTDAGGVPVTTMVLVPAMDLEVVDTWHTLGLRGTGSHDVRATAIRCPARHSLSMSGTDPEAVRIRYRIGQSSLLIAAVNVGLAQGALDDVVALATDGKRPAFSRRRLAESPLFQDRLGEAQMTCAAARALLYDQAAAVERNEADGVVPPPAERSRLRATAATVATLTSSVVDTAHGLAGGSAVYEGSPLARRLRDMHTSTQHFVNGRDYYGMLGALAAGADVDVALL